MAIYLLKVSSITPGDTVLQFCSRYSICGMAITMRRSLALVQFTDGIAGTVVESGGQYAQLRTYVHSGIKRAGDKVKIETAFVFLEQYRPPI